AGGAMYFEGHGVEKDVGKTVYLFEKACALGEVEGCLFPGQAYYYGEHVAQDEARGQALLERACELGEAEACPLVVAQHDVNWLDKYAEGLEAKTDKDCEEGDATACFMRGIAYHLGHEVEKSVEKALVYY